jgi:hypothetical protein
MKKTIPSLPSAVLRVFACSSCAKSDDQTIAKSGTYVLVHGAWQASYVVRSDLGNKGSKVVVVELP